MSLVVEGLRHVYRDGSAGVAALEDVSAAFEEGAWVGIAGPTGAGKSTLIQHLNGLLKPMAGRVFLDGADIWGRGFNRRGLWRTVGVVFQFPEEQLFEETILADIAFGPRNLGLSQEDALDRARRAMAAVGLDSALEGRSPFALSGGQRRRAAIAGVLALEPRFLVLDEPTAGLDPRGREEILGLLDRLRRERGCAVITVTHDLEELSGRADRVLVLHKGHLVAQGAPAQVFGLGDELRQWGLVPPPVAQVLAGLRACGWPVADGDLTVGAARQEILRAWTRRSRP